MQFGQFIERVRRVKPSRGWKRPLIVALIVSVSLLIGSLLLYAQFFGPANEYGETTEFIVKPDASVFEITRELRRAGFIKSSTAFSLAFRLYDKGRGIQEGGYKLSPAMDTLSIAKALASPPYLAWVTFPSGWRKEQIADLLVRKLGWSEDERVQWINVDTAPSAGLIEGVYYGDTYLIPTDQSPAYVAGRLRGRFTDVFAPYAAEAAKRGIPWTDVITLASLIEREAAKNDKEIVSGILWNRLHAKMGLQVDATLQYIRGEKGNWWPVPTSADKKLESPFNTYKHVGLPPHPIANPSLESIDAALHPAKTDCIYYIHDTNGTIHCSKSYSGHLANVNKYLK
ncbi:MAG: endolytic transglycosylase MltG [Candidatus Pacebacteria bacterium]|nr:endolytic transglycosylase MltG [Candidatus Paceibacterota bacterium]